MIYITYKCPYCGEIQTTYTNNINKSILVCKKCGKSKKLKNNNEFGWSVKVYYITSDCKKATLVCQTEKMKEGSKKYNGG